MDYGNPISYLTLEPGGDVVSSDGEVVGRVEHVLADRESDIFDGLVVDVRQEPKGLHFADAEQVAEIYERAVVLSVSAADVEGLPRPTPNPATMESHGVEDSEGALQSKLHRAWDLISGNY
ncbi:MAG: hypothetical protein QOI98_386 [Solirubrobacteraceae bacterium]|nr:hypothetical protein [Solirubrobacteraceae bacterium]